MEIQKKIVLDELQRSINKMCGVSDDEFIICFNKLAPRKNPAIDDAQCKVNALMSVSDEEFLKYGGSKTVSNKDGLDTYPRQIMFNCLNLPIVHDLQRSINKMCDISDETFNKYNK